MTLADPTGYLLTSIRSDPGVAAFTTRVRCPEPMGKMLNPAGAVIDEGDARGPGKWIRFIVITQLGRTRLKRAPLQEVRYIVKSYGVSHQDAELMAAAVSDSVHAVGHRISPSGVVVFTTFDDGGQGAESDPDTGQPMAGVIVTVGALTSLLP